MPFLYNFGALILKTTTIMKKFIIALVAVVLGLSSCSKEAQLLGSWKFDSLTAEAEGAQITITAEKMQIDAVITFKENGKVEVTANGESEVEADYTIAGNTLTINVEGESTSFEFSVDSKTLVLSGKLDGLAGDGDLSKASITFKKL